MKLNFSGASRWYVSGTVDIMNTCKDDQNLAGQTITFQGEINSTGNTFDNATAKSSFAINRASRTFTNNLVWW